MTPSGDCPQLWGLREAQQHATTAPSASRPWPWVWPWLPAFEAFGQWSDAMAPDRMEWTRAMEATRKTSSPCPPCPRPIGRRAGPCQRGLGARHDHAAMSSMSLYHKDASTALNRSLPGSQPLGPRSEVGIGESPIQAPQLQEGLGTVPANPSQGVVPERRDELRFKLGHCH